VLVPFALLLLRSEMTAALRTVFFLYCLCSSIQGLFLLGSKTKERILMACTTVQTAVVYLTHTDSQIDDLHNGLSI
jgi:hypothetical protein